MKTFHDRVVHELASRGPQAAIEQLKAAYREIDKAATILANSQDRQLQGYVSELHALLAKIRDINDDLYVATKNE